MRNIGHGGAGGLLAKSVRSFSTELRLRPPVGRRANVNHLYLYMVSKGYRAIVSVGSVAGKEGNPSVSAYSASKAGVLGLTKSLGKELALTGVLANALTRTAFMGPMLAIAPQELVDYMTAKIPMGRLGTIDETVAMICSW